MFGAFGAHALKGYVEPTLMQVFQTAVQYHFYHSLALLAVGLFMRESGSQAKTLQVSAILFLFGILLFSGSLYLMVLTGARWLGAITPLGGLSFIVGWGFLAAFAIIGSSARD